MQIFDFTKLDKLDDSLSSYANECRSNIERSPGISVSRAGLFCATLTDIMLEKHGLDCGERADQNSKINLLKKKRKIPTDIADALHTVRMKRNDEEHKRNYQSSVEDARACWECICFIGDWAWSKYCRKKVTVPLRHEEESSNEPLNTVQMLILGISFMLSIAAGILTYLITDEAVLSIFIPPLFYVAYSCRSDFSRTSVISWGLFFFFIFLIYAMLVVIAFCLWDWKISLLILAAGPLYAVASMLFLPTIDDLLDGKIDGDYFPLAIVLGLVSLSCITAGIFWLFGYAGALLIMAFAFLFCLYAVHSRDENTRYLEFPCCAGAVFAPFLYYFFGWWGVAGCVNVLLAGLALLALNYDEPRIKTAIILGLTDLLLVVAELFYLCGFIQLAVVLALVGCAVGPVCIIFERWKDK